MGVCPVAGMPDLEVKRLTVKRAALSTETRNGSQKLDLWDALPIDKTLKQVFDGQFSQRPRGLMEAR